MRNAFHEYLEELDRDLDEMAQMVIRSVNRSVEALKAKDLEAAERIIEDDIHINDMRWEIEEKSIQMIATQQPVATDLREIIAVLNIITDLERMGDYAAGISKIVLKLGNGPEVKALIDIPRMAEISVELIEKSIEAYKKRDDIVAREVSARDDEIDDLYDQVQRELIAIMLENPGKITRCTYLLWTAHNLERIGDRVTNICERIIFLVTGEMVENVS
ncbi:MAG: phosphate signaling complex protein PhoU [Balneolaceae bacterium]